MADPTNDNDIKALLAYMQTVPRPDLRANLTALVAERDGLRGELTNANSFWHSALVALVAERDALRRELTNAKSFWIPLAAMRKGAG